MEMFFGAAENAPNAKSALLPTKELENQAFL